MPDIYQHSKRGTLYHKLGEIKMQISTGFVDQAMDRPYRIVTDNTRIIVYEGEDGQMWGRFPDEFEDPQRFERISS